MGSLALYKMYLYQSQIEIEKSVSNLIYKLYS